jgi:hypothetical protein
MAEKSCNLSQVVTSHISAEVSSDASLVREVYLGVGLFNVENFIFNLGVNFFHQVCKFHFLLANLGMAVQDLGKSCAFNSWSKLHASKTVVVTHVSVETTYICNEFLVIILRDALS